MANTLPLRPARPNPDAAPPHSNGTTAEPPRPAPSDAPATLADVLRELRAIRAALQAQAAGPAEWLPIAAVCALTSLPRSTVYRLIALKQFPRPAQLGRQARRWSRRAVLDAMAAMAE